MASSRMKRHRSTGLCRIMSGRKDLSDRQPKSFEMQFHSNYDASVSRRSSDSNLGQCARTLWVWWVCIASTRETIDDYKSRTIIITLRFVTEMCARDEASAYMSKTGRQDRITKMFRRKAKRWLHGCRMKWAVAFVERQDRWNVRHSLERTHIHPTTLLAFAQWRCVGETQKSALSTYVYVALARLLRCEANNLKGRKLFRYFLLPFFYNSESRRMAQSKWLV